MRCCARKRPAVVGHQLRRVAAAVRGAMTLGLLGFATAMLVFIVVDYATSPVALALLLAFIGN
jgi:hypothetical protein